jgi:hypothetical protein
MTAIQDTALPARPHEVASSLVTWDYRVLNVGSQELRRSLKADKNSLTRVSMCC